MILEVAEQLRGLEALEPGSLRGGGPRSPGLPRVEALCLAPVTGCSGARARASSTWTWWARRTSAGSSTTAMPRASTLPPPRSSASSPATSTHTVSPTARRASVETRITRRSRRRGNPGRRALHRGREVLRRRVAFGGEAGQPYDPCYHRACDNAANVSGAAPRQMAGAAAHAVRRFARDVSDASLTASSRSVRKIAPLGTVL